MNSEYDLVIFDLDDWFVAYLDGEKDKGTDLCYLDEYLIDLINDDEKKADNVKKSYVHIGPRDWEGAPDTEEEFREKYIEEDET